MNRIYQGKVTNVQKLKNGAKGNKPEDWENFDPDPKQAKAKWQAALWPHHQLFQDAVNYFPTEPHA